MRRAPIVITATVLGTAGVLLFKPLAPGQVATETAAAPGSSDSGSASSASTSGGSSSSGSSSGTSSSASSSGSGAKDGTYTGDAETVRYGTTQVKVTIAGGKITDVVVVQENSADPRSLQISRNATPTLREEVLQQQTAAVDTVSGATYTSEQYEASLQSALDQAGFTAADGSKASTSVAGEDLGGGGFGH